MPFNFRPVCHIPMQPVACLTEGTLLLPDGDPVSVELCWTYVEVAPCSVPPAWLSVGGRALDENF